jgi:hypothetical protein
MSGLGTTNSSVFSQNPMTESPKPISPNTIGHPPEISRQRSPSLATQLQQQNFGRRPSERIQSPQARGLPGPTLPAIAGLAPPDQRYTLPSQQSAARQMAANGAQQPHHLSQQAVQPAAQMGFQAQMSQPSHQRPPQQQQQPGGEGGNGDGGANLFASQSGVWNYVQELEARVKQLGDRVAQMEQNEGRQDEKIRGLEGEVDELRARLLAQEGQGQGSGPGH